MEAHAKMTNLICKQNDLPHFCKDAPFLYGFTVVLFPLLYIVLLMLWPNGSILIFETLCFVLPCVWFFKRVGLKNALAKTNLRRKVGVVLLLSVAVSFAVNSLAQIWETFFPLPDFLMQVYERLFHMQMAFGFYFELLQIALVPAIAEELLFRGLILTGLLKHFSVKTAIVLSAAIFAVYHLNPWHLPFLFVLGIFFATVFVKTNNLILAMLAHFINNAIGVILYYQTGHF